MPARRVVVKAEPIAPPKAEKKASPRKGKKSVQMASAVCEFDTDLAKASNDENAIFSVCGEESRTVGDSPASEIGEYELSYLHNIYHQNDILTAACNNTETILPDAIAPPSLSLITNIANGAHASLESTVGAPHSTATPSVANSKDDVANSQPDTPPQKGRKTEWLTSVPDNSRILTTVNKGTRSTNRKRKIVDMEPVATGPQKNQRSSSAQATEETSEKDSSSGADCGNSPSSAQVETLDIRPEDDPLGLFARDPSTLTPEEQRIIKKQRRLLKNRESAQLSRHRKKLHLNALERQVETLKKEKASLSSRVQDLVEENERLRKQILG